MTTAQFLTAVHIILSVGIGLLVGRYARPIVRKMVVAAMPMQQRMKENFLRRLGLIAGSITIGLAMLSAGFVHLSSAKWFQSGRNLNNTSTEPLAPQLPLDRPEQPRFGSTERHFGSAQQPEEEVDADTPANPNGHQNEALSPRRQTLVLNPLASRSRSQGFDPQGSYLQLEAFDRLPNAQGSAEHWQSQLQGHPIWIARANHGPAIYKVLLGPFQHLDAVRQYRNQQGLPGFARSGEGLSEVQD